MKTNTSIHKRNADNKLSISGMVVWMLLNFINNSYFPNRAKDLCIKNFCPEIDEQDWGKIHVKSSPSRSLSDLFWLKLNWRAIKSELGRIHVFDTGAGKGGYALKLNDFADGISTYFGVDFALHKEWEYIEREYEYITMKQKASHEILDVIPHNTNFFLSQSAVEHFEDDLLYFEQVRKFIDKTSNNTIQVHLFPSAACLRLYLWHGIRQYTPKTISSIVQLFDPLNTYSILFRLGGKNCNNLHFRFITWPLNTKRVDLRDSRTEAYRNLLKIAVEKDIKQGNHKPGFYALVIHSNYNKPIFKHMDELTKRCPCQGYR